MGLLRGSASSLATCVEKYIFVLKPVDDICGTRRMNVDNPYTAGIAFCEGSFVPVDQARIPLLDWGFLRSDAVQDTVSVFHGRFFRLEDHLERFERNWQRLRMQCPYDRDTQRAILMEAVRRTGLREAYVQMIMTRGRAPIGSRDVRLANNRYWMFCIPYVWIAKPEQKERGLSMHISSIQRVPKETVDPTIKHYHWLDFQMALMEGYERGADTCAVVDRDGNISEGPGFNIFAVKGGIVTTPPESVCLDGMTRDTVFKLAAETNLQIRKAAVSPDALREADEVFITTTGGGVIGITSVDGRAIGSGGPGPVTRRLDDLYWSRRQAGWLTTPVDYEASLRFPALA
jgi:branched-subunit amino acid aminotransferase/4-amino-4-deoxychorismate lyase